MRKVRINAAVLIIAVVMLLTLPPLGITGASAADWTQLADNGVDNTNNTTMIPGTTFKGKFALGSIPLPTMDPPGPVSAYLWDGSTFEQIGTDGFGNPDCQGLIPTAVYQGELYIGLYDDTNGGELFTWNGSGDPILVPESEDGWHQGADYTSVIPLGIMNGELIVCVQNETGIWSGACLMYKYDGTNWEQIVGGASGVPAGFGNANNMMAINLTGERTLYDGNMVFVVQNIIDGLSVYSYDGTDFTNLGSAGDPGLWSTAHKAGVCTSSWVDGNLYLGTYNPGGTGQIWSYNGSDWSNVSTTGIDANYEVLLVQARGSRLYVGAGAGDGCNVFMRNEAGWETIAEKNFGQTAADVNIWALIRIYNGSIMAPTSNGNGAEVWSAPIPSTYYFAEGTTRNNTIDGSYEEWISIQNPGEVDANVDLTYMLGDGTTQVQSIVVEKTSRSTVSVNSFLGPDIDVSTMVTSDQQIVAERPMYFNYRNKWIGGDNVMGIADPRTDFYFAEGTTRDNPNDGSYEEWLCLQNPGVKDATVDVTYMLGTGDSINKEIVVPATSRHTQDVNLDIGPNQDVSMVVNSDEPIIAERPMYFNYRNKWVGGHNVVGAASPDTEFYFAEGTTRDNPTDGSYEEWLCLQNSYRLKATVTITYYTAAGAVETQEIEVPGTSRRTVDVKNKLGPDVDASCYVRSNLPILVERPMYFSYKGVWNGGHNVIGCASPMTGFNFAEGTTRNGFATYVAVMNPGDDPADVTLSYMLGDGTNAEVTVTIAPKQRYTRDVVADVGLDQDVSIAVESNRVVVAERPMYFYYHDWCTGGSDTLGLNL